MFFVEVAVSFGKQAAFRVCGINILTTNPFSFESWRAIACRHLAGSGIFRSTFGCYVTVNKYNYQYADSDMGK
uniref:Uncharacterized protein n=1 Tax=Rhizophora mucronata TaxID=61149 RepID=A0A2P2NKA7_RHIMU